MNVKDAVMKLKRAESTAESQMNLTEENLVFLAAQITLTSIRAGICKRHVMGSRKSFLFGHHISAGVLLSKVLL